MQNFLNKYNAVKLENTQDEGKLTLDSSKKRILKMLDENMKHIKNNSWNIKNRMNKLIVDTETNSIFTLRLGGKKIIKYSLYLLNDREKLLIKGFIIRLKHYFSPYYKLQSSIYVYFNYASMQNKNLHLSLPPKNKTSIFPNYIKSFLTIETGGVWWL